MDLTSYFDHPDSDECKEWLVSSFKQYIIEGGSMDVHLSLVSVGYNAPNARTEYYRRKRSVAIDTAWEVLVVVNEDKSERECVSLLFDKINDKNNKGELIREIHMCDHMLGKESGYSSVDSLHAAIKKLNKNRVEEIATLLKSEDM